jgi:hypothetical protein
MRSTSFDYPDNLQLWKRTSLQQTPAQICSCLLLSSLRTLMFCVSLVPLAPFSHKAAHHGYTVPGIFKENDLREERELALPRPPVKLVSVVLLLRVNWAEMLF